MSGPVEHGSVTAGGIILLSWPAISQVQAAQEAPTDQPAPGSQPTPAAAQPAPTEPSAQPAATGTTQQEEALEKDASTSDGQARVTQRLAQEFGVPESQITDLRAKKLGYGEVHQLLAIAQQMPGGITQDNVNKVLAMRQEQHMGWGRISQEVVGQKLGPTLKQGDPATSSQPTTSAPASSQPQSVTKPGRGAGNAESGGVRGNHSIAPGGAHPGGGFGGGSATGGLGGARGKSSAAPGHNR